MSSTSTPLVSHTEITPEYAEHLLTNAHPDWQRGIKPHHLENLTRDMSEGRWCDWTVIRLAQTENGLVLMDGQHRLSAIVASSTAQKFVVLTEFLSEDEARKKYAVYIDTGRNRTVSDLLKAVGIPDNLTLHAAKVLTQSAKIVKAEFTRSFYISNEVAYEVAMDYLEEYARVSDLLRGSDLSADFNRSPYIASSIYVMRWQVEKAMTFLRDVITGEVANPHDPTRRLREFILSNTSKHEAKYNREVRMKVFSRCWNAAYTGQTLQKIYPPRTIKFFGTPLASSNGATDEDE